jgi:hypothetical protein
VVFEVVDARRVEAGKRGPASDSLGAEGVLTMPGRSLRWATAALLVGLLTVPVHAGAGGGSISFPPVGAGSWEGALFFSGDFSSDTVRDDGSFDATLRDVIDSTTITLVFTVDGAGMVTNGEMRVDLTWFQEGAGTSPTTFAPYHVVHDHHQTGILALSGTADRLVAGGELLWETNTVAGGDVVEEVSGSETVSVEWIFKASEATCAHVSGGLIEARGNSFIRTALFPRGISSGDGATYYNGLVAEFIVWPTDVGDPGKVEEALEALQEVAGALLSRQFPEMEHVIEVVDAWGALNAELARLESCQAALVGWVPESSGSWLVGIVQLALSQALESQDHYDVSDLVGLWVAGFQVEAMDGELVVGFLDAFRAKLTEAITLGDVATIQDILAFAAQYGYPNLYADAKAALEGAP